MGPFDFLEARLVHLDQCLPVFVVSLLDVEPRNFEVPHVRDIDVRPQAHVFAIHQHAQVHVGKQLAIGRVRVIEFCRQSRVLFRCFHVLFPRFKRVVASKEENARFARLRFRRQVVRGPLGLCHRLDKGTFGLLVRHPVLPWFRPLPRNTEDLRRRIATRVLRHCPQTPCHQTCSYPKPRHSFHRESPLRLQNALTSERRQLYTRSASRATS